MLAASDGRMICLSTPYGRRGFFYDCRQVEDEGAADLLRAGLPMGVMR
jgi:hypothetical protein